MLRDSTAADIRTSSRPPNRSGTTTRGVSKENESQEAACCLATDKSKFPKALRSNNSTLLAAKERTRPLTCSVTTNQEQKGESIRDAKRGSDLHHEPLAMSGADFPMSCAAGMNDSAAADVRTTAHQADRDPQNRAQQRGATGIVSRLAMAKGNSPRQCG